MNDSHRNLTDAILPAQLQASWASSCRKWRWLWILAPKCPSWWWSALSGPHRIWSHMGLHLHERWELKTCFYRQKDPGNASDPWGWSGAVWATSDLLGSPGSAAPQHCGRTRGSRPAGIPETSSSILLWVYALSAPCESRGGSRDQERSWVTTSWYNFELWYNQLSDNWTTAVILCLCLKKTKINCLDELYVRKQDQVMCHKLANKNVRNKIKALSKKSSGRVLWN